MLFMKRNTSKCAVRGLTECLRYELAPFNVKVTVVCPAEVATEIFGDPKNIPPDAISISRMNQTILFIHIMLNSLPFRPIPTKRLNFLNPCFL
jgi:NAD(P)-dependent dehydrogenase (short-subunit alcohol dehydrogenase family)